jgi:hypothetical protein
MPKVFVSYARADQEMVQSLVRELQELGYDPFYDQNLTGGQRWWDVLLDQIQAADGFLPVLTSEYRQSEACHREAVWAESLGVPFVPIDLGQASPDLFEKVVAESNWVHYSLDDRSSVARLARALGAMHKPEPPAPLPPRPAIPISYFAELEREIRTMPAIPLERQFAIIATLRAKLYTREDASARIMLGELRSRTDITYSNAVDIERMLAGLAPEQAAQQQQSQPVDARQHHWHHDAGQPQSRHGAGSQQGGQQDIAHQSNTGYQQRGGDRPGSTYGQTGYQHRGGNEQGASQQGGYQRNAPPQPVGNQRYRRAAGPTPAAIVRFSLLALGALFVLLAMFALDYVSFRQPNGSSPGADFGEMGDLVDRQSVSGVPGLSKVFFEWLGYILIFAVLAATLVCMLLKHVSKQVRVITLSIAALALLLTILSVVLLGNRSKDQGYPVGYEAGFWLNVIAIVVLAIAALIPGGRTRESPPYLATTPR